MLAAGARGGDLEVRRAANALADARGEVLPDKAVLGGVVPLAHSYRDVGGRVGQRRKSSFLRRLGISGKAEGQISVSLWIIYQDLDIIGDIIGYHPYDFQIG